MKAFIGGAMGGLVSIPAGPAISEIQYRANNCTDTLRSAAEAVEIKLPFNALIRSQEDARIVEISLPLTERALVTQAKDTKTAVVLRFPTATYLVESEKLVLTANGLDADAMGISKASPGGLNARTVECQSLVRTMRL